jgi:hypothetical protein
VVVGSGVALGGLLGVTPPPAPSPAAKGATSRVVLIRSREVLTAEGVVQPKVLHDMLNKAVCALLDEKEPAAAWRRLVKPDDVVGIKTNVWRPLPTPPELESALSAEVVAAGVKPENVGVDDRGVRENPLFQRATALVDVRPMRTHAWSGLGTCLKNYIMFVENPPDYHPDGCANLGALWKLPQVAGKTRLNVLVMLTPQFHSLGPHSFSREYIWSYGGLVVGTDPVAVDATGARIMAAKRLEFFKGERPLSPAPHHIQLADTVHHIGNADPARIDLVRLGWEEGAMI